MTKTETLILKIILHFQGNPKKISHTVQAHLDTTLKEAREKLQKKHLDLDDLSSRLFYKLPISRHQDFSEIRDAFMIVELEKMLKEMQGKVFSDITPKFFNSLDRHIDHPFYKYFRTWILSGLTLSSKEPDKTRYSFQIENRLKEIRAILNEPHGQGLFPRDVNRDLIRSLYLSGDERLISLFATHLPIPRPAIFEGHPLPLMIRDRVKELNKIIKLFLKKNGPFSVIESKIIALQRKFRARKRQKEEKARLALYFAEGILDRGLCNEETVLRDANTPYMPQGCSPKLAHRIFEAAKQVILFSTIKHLSSATYLHQILDGCLYGRQNLLVEYLCFKESCLGADDLHFGGGDANSICFGPGQIDPEAIQEDAVEITLALSKLGANPCIFYKQRDLNFFTKEVSEVPLNKSHCLFFKPASESVTQKKGFTDLEFMNKSGWGYHPFRYASIPNCQLIAYDQSKMHQILTLNFFRFLDNVRRFDDTPDEQYIQRIYADIEKLNDQELLAFLEKLGKEMTKTAEFNFYGAYKIPFEAIISIRQSMFDRDSQTAKQTTIKMPELIEKLQLGQIDALEEAKAQIPTLFQSTQFLDYLISIISDKESVAEISILRERCCTSSLQNNSPPGVTPQFLAQSQAKRQKPDLTGDRSFHRLSACVTM